MSHPAEKHSKNPPTQGGCRIGVDIGGTFTDIAVDNDGTLFTCKVPTTAGAPEDGVFQGIRLALEETGLAPADFRLVVHGTTLATNALIERKGARTAMLVTEGFRDAVEIAHENRFEQYDIFMDKPPPLVPREFRFEIAERVDARGNVLIPLEEDTLGDVMARLRDHRIESVAIGLMHSYAAPDHERRLAEILAREFPEMWISLSSEVSPEIREYERWSTTAANAYVQPLMARYLGRLSDELRSMGFSCPLCLMTSGGGLTSVETARRFPIRLVESGPAGGVILAARLARECGLRDVLSFDMGGTTAKICLIEDGEPQYSRSFEVARQYRFLKGSGLPLRIPVVEMVEIGAGGGSIARVDAMSRILVGPESAGAAPGPACYAFGGRQPTVTDADVALGRIDPAAFAGGTITLDPGLAVHAIDNVVGSELTLSTTAAAFGISEVVEENMANAARVHAIERGKQTRGRTLVAFGGAAPLHAGRLAGKLGIDEVVIPVAAGVGSAIGFLQAPVAYEVVRSRYAPLNEGFDPDLLNTLYAEMRREAEDVVASAAPGSELVERRAADMRYTGQGHEITVALPAGPYENGIRNELVREFDEIYRSTYGRHIPDLDIEVMSWTLRLSAATADPEICPPVPSESTPVEEARRELFDHDEAHMKPVPVYRRDTLAPGDKIAGPAVIVEDGTGTIVLDGFTARINLPGHIVMRREE